MNVEFNVTLEQLYDIINQLSSEEKAALMKYLSDNSNNEVKFNSDFNNIIIYG